MMLPVGEYASRSRSFACSFQLAYILVAAHEFVLPSLFKGLHH